MTRFAGRTAIVSGASSGIGLAVAERLLSEGASVLIVGAPADAGDLEAAVTRLREDGGTVDGLAADIADDATATRAVELAQSRLGRVDVLVNNAGIAYFEDVFDTPIEHLDRTYSVNVRGTFAMSMAAARAMAADGRGGAIVNTASTASFLGEEFQVTYNITKGAVAALTRSLAIDLAPSGIRVNAVAPGWVRTRATTAIIEDPEQWNHHRLRVPLRRAADPSEVAAVHAFLASDDAAYVTGAVYVVDGGMTAGFGYGGPKPDVPTALHRPGV
jgi:NAD(P)-dependent dehydrogenase (short-subunit alcohol dehydrogenase family)